MLASALKPKSAGRPLSAVAVNPAVGGTGSVQAHARELLNNIQATLVGVASARIKEYIGELVPGFDEQYRRVEQRAAAVDPTTPSIGRTTGWRGNNGRPHKCIAQRRSVSLFTGSHGGLLMFTTIKES